jgi:Dolichyl-phosphate-mannose-protein mannosyltransferase
LPWLAALLVLAAGMLLLRLSAYGIWDPWELGTAEAARSLLEGQRPSGHISLSTWLASRGFGLFGVSEWAGRLPIAVCGLLTALLSFALVARHTEPRVGFYAALVTVSSPLLLLGSRAMLGEAPSFLLQGGIAYCAMRAVFPGTNTPPRPSTQGAWLAAVLALTGLSFFTRGVLLTALPPIAAVSVTSLLLRERSLVASWAPAFLAALTALLGAFVARDVWNDSTVHSGWLGGRALSSAPPTFDATLEDVFHAFAPWSALLPIAVVTLWQRSLGEAWTDGDEASRADRETPLALTAMVWAALGYAAHTLFVSRYGADATYLPVVALAALVALLLAQVERRGGAHWNLALTALFLVSLLLRDFVLFPNGPVSGLPIAGFELPKAFNAKAPWAGLLAAFGACALLGFAARSEASLALAAPYRFFRDQWRRGLGFKLWLVILALLLLGTLVFGALAYAVPTKLGLPTVAVKWVQRLAYVVPAIAGGIAAFQLALFGFGKLGRHRFVPMLAAGAAIGVYAGQFYLPAFSDHLSPREVYDTYNSLAKPGETLGQYEVSGRAATYYAKGQVTDLDTQAELVDHLAAKSRRWAAFPADDLASLNRAYRKRTGEHIVIADARSARVLLGTNLPLPGKAKAAESFLQSAVRKQPPARIQHPLSINFDDRIELLGYDTRLPQGTYVGAGETFTLTWYFRCKRPIAGTYRIFIHIDGDGRRIHGDHDPVDGKYPVRMWDEGDVIHDSHEVSVPSSYPPGEYAIHMGFYSGSTRLPIIGDHEDNRVRVGVLRVR